MKNPYKQLTLKERYQIETLSKQNLSARNIAKHLKRGNKAISNELQRCSLGHYCGDTAHAQVIPRTKTGHSIKRLFAVHNAVGFDTQLHYAFLFDCNQLQCIRRQHDASRHGSLLVHIE